MRGQQCWRWGPSECLLLLLAGLTLVDGVYAGAVEGGVLRSLISAVVFGCTCFSGAGCLAAVMAVGGGLRARLAVVARVYAVVGVGAIVGALIIPFTAPVLLPHFSTTVSPVILLEVGILLWPKPARAKSGEVDVVNATGKAPEGDISWRRAFTLILNPRVTLAAAATFSFVHAVAALRNGSLHVIVAHAVNVLDVLHAAIAVGVAAVMTAAGAALASSAQKYLRPDALRRGGAASLGLIAVDLVIGSPMPGYLPMIPLSAAVVIGVVRGALIRASRDSVEAPKRSLMWRRNPSVATDPPRTAVGAQEGIAREA